MPPTRQMLELYSLLGWEGGDEGIVRDFGFKSSYFFFCFCFFSFVVHIIGVFCGDFCYRSENRDLAEQIIWPEQGSC